MKKILIVSYHFPPDAAVGALRAAKFAKYLPQLGWEPIVLTVKEKYYPRTDISKVKDINHVREIYRTTMLPHPRPFYLRLKAVRQRGPFSQSSPLNPPIRKKTRSPISFLKRFILSLEYLPDDKQVWIPAAAFKGLRIVTHENIHYMLTSGPPMSCHVIGLLLKTLRPLKWIADFRDPWLTNPVKSPEISTAFSDAVHGWLEKMTVLKADKVVAATDRIQADLEKRYPGIRGKTQVILNGYDPADFDRPVAAVIARDPQKLTLTHTGSIYGARTAEPFLRSLADLVHSGRIPKDGVTVKFIGSSPGIRTQAATLGLAGIVSVIDFTDYQTCIQHLYASDALLLFAQDQPTQIPGKMYDYIAVQKPMLIFTSDGATADLAKKMNCGTIVDPDDSVMIRQRLGELYDRFECDGLPVERNDHFTPELTKPQLTQQLIEGIE